MENNKPTGTTEHISKLIEEAKQKGHEVIVIGSGDSGRLSAEAIMAMVKDKNNAIIVIEDIDKVFEDKKKNPAFERPPIEIKMLSEPLPEIKLRRDDMNKQWYEKFAKGKKKRKW